MIQEANGHQDSAFIGNYEIFMAEFIIASKKYQQKY